MSDDLNACQTNDPMAQCLAGDAAGPGGPGGGRRVLHRRKPPVHVELLRLIHAGLVEQCLAGTASDWPAFVCFCQAEFEVSIYRALLRNGPYYREFARDAFQDLCCVLLVDPARVLCCFAGARVSLRTFLTRWVRRRVWGLMHGRDRLAQSQALASVPEPAAPRSAEEVEELGDRLKERARLALCFLTRGQRIFVEAVLEGRLAEVVRGMTQGTLRKILYRMRRRLQGVADYDQHEAQTRIGVANATRDAQPQAGPAEPRPMVCAGVGSGD